MYQCLTKVSPRVYDPDVQKVLNDLGAQGWRFMENRPTTAVAAYGDIYCFERRY